MDQDGGTVGSERQTEETDVAKMVGGRPGNIDVGWKWQSAVMDDTQALHLRRGRNKGVVDMNGENRMLMDLKPMRKASVFRLLSLRKFCILISSHFSLCPCQMVLRSHSKHQLKKFTPH